MSTGRIVVELSTNNKAQPIRNASVVIIDSETNRVVARQTVGETDSGKTSSVSVPAPDISLSLTDETRVLPYAIYNVTVSAPAYYDYTVRGVQVFADRVSILEAELLPLPVGTPSGESVIDIPTHSLFSPIAPIERNQVYDNSPQVLSRVVIPEYVTVHLGTPNQSARNVTVSFPDYIKNVCCSEIYSTWPTEALKANIYAQISLVLNRIYTEWYRSRGYSFDITNSTAYDQYFVYGRNIEQNISDLVDGMFTMYVRKVGTLNPYYTEYCDGSSVWCPGMKQWGTVTLANNGYSALQILRYYYGTDIEIVEADVVEGIPVSYPGSPLRVGSSGTDVSTVQRQLARIAQNYPAIGSVPIDGIFGTATETAVKRFQSIFNLSSDGIVGSATWYKISYIYVAVKKLAELSSEGESYAGDGQYPGTPLRLGSSGSSVSSLQYYINVIANTVSFISSVTVDGIFGSATETSVKQLQSLYGLTVDGIVGPTTWNAVYNLYKAIINNADISIGTDYPGTPLRIGSEGENVRIMQSFLAAIAEVFPTIPSPTVDGVFGVGTESSVKAFQEVFGLSVDGVIGEQSWNRITEVFAVVADFAYAGTPLRIGSEGAAVRELQEMLNFVGKTYTSIPSLTVDGSFGAGTRRAVIEFQSLFGIDTDGVVGSVTWNVLLREYLILLYNPSASDANVYPGTPLRIGSRGESVLRIQSYLNNIGRIFPELPQLTTDGIFGEATAGTVRILQEIFSLTPDGIVGENTWNLIVNLNLSATEYAYSGAALYRGSSGDKVLQLQGLLNSVAGVYPSIPTLVEDGNFGNQTQSAVTAFQQIFGLSPDGIVGEKTWNTLLKEYLLIMNSQMPISSDVYPGTPLRFGSVGPNVLKMKNYLNIIRPYYQGFTQNTTDTYFDRRLETNVRTFQSLFGLFTDGVIGEITWNKIVEIKDGVTSDAYAGTLLRYGSSGAQVRKLQQKLNFVRDYYGGIPALSEDGIFGSATESAVRAYQRDKGLSQDGIVGPNTWNALIGDYWLYYDGTSPRTEPFPGTLLRVGSSGSDVLKMQRYLNIISDVYAGIGKLVPDGIFGSRTKASVQSFQRLFGLSPDGIIGQLTWDRIIAVKNEIQNGSYSEPAVSLPLASEEPVFEELSLGSRGEAVTEYQRLVNRIAAQSGEISAVEENGVFGFALQNATRCLQKLLGAEQNGKLTKEFYDALKAL